MLKTAVIILAAGKGTRMNSKYQKILHEVGGKPMVQHVFEASQAVSDVRPVMVVAPGEDGVPELFGDLATYVPQAERLGTGHATQMAENALRGQADQVIVTYGDMPLLKQETLQKLVDKRKESGAAVTMLTVMGEPESSFGRIVRNRAGKVTEICEVAEAKQRKNTQALLNIRELNVGIYCFDAKFLWDNIASLPQRKARNGNIEYYLTDMVAAAVKQKREVITIITDDASEALGAGTRAEMVDVERLFRQRTVQRWLAAGVTIVSPEQTYIDPDVTIGQDSVIWPNSYLQGDTVVGDDCVIGPNTIVRSAEIGDRCVIEQAVIEGVIVEPDTYVAPFTHVLPFDEQEESNQ